MDRYQKLQKLLSECIKLWYRYKFINWDEEFVCTTTSIFCGDPYEAHEMSYHELFSKDSWLMKFVDWDVTNKTMDYLYHHWIWEDYKYITHKWEAHYHYMMMWPMTADEKIDYFLQNAKLPE